jgi:hypothetical protein
MKEFIAVIKSIATVGFVVWMSEGAGVAKKLSVYGEHYAI